MKQLFRKNRKKPSPKMMVLFFKQLAALITAHIPLSQTCQLLAQSQPNWLLQHVIHTIQCELEAGRGLSMGLKKFPLLFNSLICQLIEMGELSGTLEARILQAANILEKSFLLKNQIKQALFYPLIVLSIALVICCMMLIFIVPRFEEFFTSLHGQLPYLTRCIIQLSNWVRHDYGIAIILALALLLFYNYIKDSNPIKNKIYRYVRQLPLIKQLLSKLFILHFIQNLSVIYAAGINITDGLKLIANACTLPQHKAIIFKLNHRVSSGQQLNIAIKSCAIFPALIVQMVRIGEESGTLHKMLKTIENLYESDLTAMINQLDQLLEPLIMVILGALIGGLVIAMYLPIFKLGMAI